MSNHCGFFGLDDNVFPELLEGLGLPLMLSILSLSGMLAVLAGAFGAHALTTVLEPKALGWWHTAVEYHFYHTFSGLLCCILAAQYQPLAKLLHYAAGFAVSGVLLFSGSLYAMALSGWTYLGLLTPLGGLCFVLAWGLPSFGFARYSAAIKLNKNSNEN